MPELIDVEEPNQPMVTISIEKATEDYMLDKLDLRTLRTDGGVVWCKDVALTMHQDEE